MAEKKNEILEEQRRARQEFLNLKKMQHGEMSAPPKPSEMAILPKTPKEKAANFWFQYKWHVIATVLITAVLAIMIVQCATKPKYDMEVVYFSYHTVMDEQLAPVKQYLAQYAKDLNGDGKTAIQIINCSYDKNSANTQYAYSIMTKLQAMIAGDENALLFITDPDSYAYFGQLSEEGIFEGEPVVFGPRFYEAVHQENWGDLPEGLQISCRRVTDTTLEKKKNVAKIFHASQDLIAALEENQN